MKFANLLIIFWLGLSIQINSQSVQSEAYKKKGLSRHSSLINPKYPSYNLAATFVLKEKARSGDPFAQHELGLRYIMGIGLPKDTVKAAYWIGKAADKKLPAANFNYAIMLHGGIGTKWNPFEAYKNFKVSAESGMEQAQYILGLMYTDNLIVNKNLMEAKKWLKKSAEKGFEEAKKVLAEFEKQGIKINDNELPDNDNDGNNSLLNSSTLFSSEYELEFYNFGADSLTDEEEQESLNKILLSKSADLKRMLKIESNASNKEIIDTTAFGLINFAAKSGSPEAILIKARLIEKGLGVEKNLVLAASNYLKAFRLGSFKAAESLLKISLTENFYTKLESEIKNNNPEAMFVWAGLIALGMDYSLSEKQAFELLEKASKKEHINSIIEIGLAYLSGTLVKKDSISAINNFKLAYELGSSEAKVRLAFLDVRNKSSKTRKESFNTLNEFAGKGSVLAQAALAFLYENGVYVHQNKGKAANLYRQASQRGNEAAYNSLRNMYDKIRPKDEMFQIIM